ncbi:hypothetical protein [Kitasatospora azatica]|uniref:hypothetical protein n=1 Tax=Kitasatospora azatica TaxID=58347 RepID=UPI00056749AF|nr:hypothetical protein [Kitasatospora azatica]
MTAALDSATAASDPVPDALGGLVRCQLRPGVGVTPLRDGLHLRGWRSSVTLEGSRALPALWQLLEEALRTGDHTALTVRAPAGSPLRTALNALIGHLHAHDLLVDRAEPASRWLHALSRHPAAAAAAIAAAHPQVLCADPTSPFAQAAARALHRAGATPSVAAPLATSGPAGLLVLLGPTGGPGRSVAVAARMSGDGGFVTAPGTPEQVTADATALAARLGRAAGDGSSAPAALTALVAGAAAQRLVCAVGGLPDPASEGDDRLGLPGRPSVLVADADPLRAEYHAWLGPRLPGSEQNQDHPAPLAPPDTLAQALRRVAALGDERLGVLPPPLPGVLPQLPVALVGCPIPGGTLLAAGARTDLARLDAVCRAAELRLSEEEFDVAVGATPEHARGRALRRAASRAGGERLPARSWADHPQARHWWRTLTERLHRPAELSVERLGSGAHCATVHVAGHRLSRPLSRAVEATPGDAAAFAALGAVARTVSADMTFRQLSVPSGASAALAVAGLVLTGWEDEGWTTGWLAGIATREPALLAALRRETGMHREAGLHLEADLRATPLREAADPENRALAAALLACGFTVLSTPGGAAR